VPGLVEAVQTDWVHLPLARYIKTPCLTTLHGRLDLPFMQPMVQGFEKNPFVSISHSQRGPLPEFNWAAIVYHGLPEIGGFERRFTARRMAHDYLTCFEHCCLIKGKNTHVRIHPAIAAGQKVLFGFGT
jgi:hypothetical protein